MQEIRVGKELQKDEMDLAKESAVSFFFMPDWAETQRNSITIPEKFRL
jgi:hypothetical protein